MNKKGFTLTEILIVIVIGITLVALIVPRALRAIAQSNYLADQQNMKTIDEALMLCFADTRDWSKCPAAALSDLTPKYLKAVPTNPCVGGDTYGSAAVPVAVGVAGHEATNSAPCAKPS